MASFNYGGQAVVEGVMMRGRRSVAVAVRRQSGDILVHEEALNPRVYANRLFQLPFLRGVLLLWDMLILGTRMLSFAASASQTGATADESGTAVAVNAHAAARGTSTAHAHASSDLLMPDTTAATPAVEMPRVVQSGPHDVPSMGGPGLALTLVLSLAFAVALFFLTPVALVNLARHWLGVGWLSLAAEGAVRLALLLAYIWLIGRMPGVRRVFEYHGAEHKAINTYEAGLPLDVEHVRAASKVHTRCGTGFLLLVMVVSIFVFALVGQPALPWLVLSRVLLIPVVAGIAYELMRLGAANYRFRVVRWLLAPGLALQGLTTRQPDDQQIQCAIVALDRVLRQDKLAGIPVRVA